MATKVISYTENIGVLVYNSGVMGDPYSLTKDGSESPFGIHHIGHFLFTNIIIEKLLSVGPGVHVFSVASNGYRLGPIRFGDWNFAVSMHSKSTIFEF